jgi:hypothetical protein
MHDDDALLKVLTKTENLRDNGGVAEILDCSATDDDS